MSTEGDDEAARSPPGQGECIASEPTEPRLEDEAEPVLVSADVSMLDVSMLARRQSSLLRAAMVDIEVADLIQSS